MIGNIQNGKALPVYGDGANVRDWLYVVDHASAIWAVINKGRLGETYNVGGENEWKNLDLVNYLCEEMARAMGKDKDFYKSLITFVKDRPGHDQRYAIDCSKIKKELGWTQSVTFEVGLRKTVEWYLSNIEWVSHVTSGEYQKWVKDNYGAR